MDLVLDMDLHNVDIYIVTKSKINKKLSNKIIEWLRTEKIAVKSQKVTQN